MSTWVSSCQKKCANDNVRQWLKGADNANNSITKSFNTILPWFSSFRNKINCFVGMFLQRFG